MLTIYILPLAGWPLLGLGQRNGGASGPRHLDRMSPAATGTSPSCHLAQELGLWLVRGPLGTVMWPQAERSCCLFAEGGRTPLRTIDSASPWSSLLSSQCLPWQPGSGYARWWAWNQVGAALASKPKQGWTSRSKVAQETAWALPLKMAVISALEGGKTSGIPHAQSVVPQPPSDLSHPLFPPRLRVV